MGANFYRLITAQFVSGLADNALLLVAIALHMEQGGAGWWIPLIKFSFTTFYVLTAPVAGVLSDRWPKPRVMLVANGIKALGCLGMLLGLPVIPAMMIVGLGAALYSPAKYGLITELVPASQLVKANGWIEISTVGAAVLGIMMGGFLISETFTLNALTQVLRSALNTHSLLCGSLAFTVLCYVLASILNLWIQGSQATYPRVMAHPAALLRQTTEHLQRMWSDTEAGMSLGVTTLFWGVSATMQLLVLQWSQSHLGMSLDRAAYLQGAVAVGVVGGAFLAARWVSLEGAWRVLPMGLVLGISLPCMNWIHHPGVALALMVLVGACGGFFVVPMNALLQHRGCQLLTAGQSIAIQNFNENLSVMAMMLAYSGLMALDLSFFTISSVLGAWISAGMLLIAWRYHTRKRSAALGE
ncbi:MAG: lysophospholipid transporter LplT [Limnohabitans sp.]|nr:lysophospholipid transporter LplT [Limnohabitans sp.]